MDERSNLIVARAMGITLGIVYLGIIISCIWKYVVTKDITNSSLEIILIVAIPVAIGWFARKDESLALPRDISGEPLSTRKDQAAKQDRKRHYFWHAFAFALFVLIMDSLAIFFIERDFKYYRWFAGLSDTQNIWAVLFIEFIIGICIFYALGYLMNEHIVKRYNKKIDKLEKNNE